MATAEEIRSLQERLATHRATLGHLLKQQAQFGSAHTPAYVFHGITEARQEIARLKAALTQLGATVAEHPDDLPPPPLPSEPVPPPPAAVSDEYSHYERATAALLQRLQGNEPAFGQALIQKRRLDEQLERVRRYGDNETRRSDRSEVLARLDALARQYLGRDFDSLS